MPAIYVLFDNCVPWRYVSHSVTRPFLSAKGVACETKDIYGQTGEVSKKWVGQLLLEGYFWVQEDSAQDFEGMLIG